MYSRYGLRLELRKCRKRLTGMVVLVDMAQRIERGWVSALEDLEVRMRDAACADAALCTDRLPGFYFVCWLNRLGLGVQHIDVESSQLSSNRIHLVNDDLTKLPADLAADNSINRR